MTECADRMGSKRIVDCGQGRRPEVRTGGESFIVSANIARRMRQILAGRSVRAGVFGRRIDRDGGKIE